MGEVFTTSPGGSMSYQGMSLMDWYRDLRYRAKKIYSFFIRGYHGVAPMDTWSLDRHVFRVLARGMRILAKDAHGYPMWIPEEYCLETDEHGQAVNTDVAVQCWQDWLIEQAGWLDWYLEDDIGFEEDSTELQKIAAINTYDKKYKTFKEVILPGIMKHIDSLWD
jgi:hypothetical protein